MTFEQWTKEMSKGLSPRNDERLRTPGYNSEEGEADDADLTRNPSHNSELTHSTAPSPAR